MSLQAFSPAKINLFLCVLDKRDDGYHNIASLFQAIDLGDDLSFTLGDQDALSCDDPLVPIDHSNLIFRAAALFREKTGLKFGVRVFLKKRIPMQAGLGGGSSNAATTLWALNELLGKPATGTQLASWSALIGSDIPFFFSNGSAYCTGKGECVTSLSPSEGQVVLFKPKQSLSTKLMFQKIEPEHESLCPNRLLRGHLEGNPIYINDFEKVALALLPSLKDLKLHLIQAGYPTVCMTGSGTAFFCLGRGRPVKIEGVQQKVSTFLHRKVDSWYEKRQECLL